VAWPLFYHELSMYNGLEGKGTLMMKCDRCHTNHATHHVTDQRGGKLYEVHLCVACLDPMALDVGGAMPVPKATRRGRGPCPHCGITVAQIEKTMRLGCPYDYQHFEGMAGLIERIHGASQHTGKKPGDPVAPRPDRTQELVKLKKELAEVVKTENYERAAALRDQIRKLEEER